MRSVAVHAALFVALAWLWPAVAAQQGDGSVLGVVTLTVARGAPLATSAYGRRGVAPKAGSPGPETRNVVVYLLGMKPATRPTPMRASIRQRGERFVPPVTVATVGSTVDFPNEDPFFHNVFSLSRMATFDLGRYPSGQSRAQQFSRPGIVKVFCHIHSQMSALVMLMDHPWFAVPNDTGAFSLADVPAGDHTLVAWHERIGERRERIRVTPGGTLRVSFTLPVLEPHP